MVISVTNDGGSTGGPRPERVGGASAPSAAGPAQADSDRCRPRPHPGSVVIGFEDASCLTRLRAWLREHIPSGDDRQIDAELMCTELVTNALEHARGPRTVRVDVIDHAVLSIAVDDADPNHQPLHRQQRPHPQRHPDDREFAELSAGPRGRGIALVAALGRWGVTRHRSYKTVWASLALT